MLLYQQQKKNQRFQIQSEINIVPFLDILLILLIIFMMIPFQLIQGFQVNLPHSTKAVSITEDNKYAITIEILKEGLYNFIYNNKHINNINASKLSSEINNIVQTKPDVICLIAAASIINYSEIIHIFNLLSTSGIYSIGMMTNPIN
ncbi:protein TolR [Candidatus Blochmanniella vafra str. BVAF]|uniref:Protein TolR n=2 Tax=Candidatus Blochmanniella vafra TaxID=251535 RepID=E8Q6Y5_BLOVB|nr:protein TolR [Candidatus Blochmannia vafer str. BVAF]